jgi:hypothetical protein
VNGVVFITQKKGRTPRTDNEGRKGVEEKAKNAQDGKLRNSGTANGLVHDERQELGQKVSFLFWCDHCVSPQVEEFGSLVEI